MKYTIGAVTLDTFTAKKLVWCLWPDLSKINLPWKISMVKSKRRKKSPMIFNGVNSKGFSIPKGMRVLCLTLTWKSKNKIAFFSGSLSCCLEENRCWHSRFHIKIKVSRNFKINFELVRWARFRKDISQKYVLLLACNRKVECCGTVKWNLLSRFKERKMLFTLLCAKLSGLTSGLSIRAGSQPKPTG